MNLDSKVVNTYDSASLDSGRATLVSSGGKESGIRNESVYAVYMPHGISVATIGGQDYT